MAKSRMEVVFNRLPGMDARAQAGLQKVVDTTGENVQKAARARAPYKTGHLHDSIEYEPTGDLEGEVQVGAEYGLFVEFGTVNAEGEQRNRAQPYLNPSVEEQRSGFETALGKAIEGAAGSKS